MRNFLICCVQEAVEQLVANIAGLAAPASLFYFDFLHLDVLEGGTQAVGYANTAKASLNVVHLSGSNISFFSFHFITYSLGCGASSDSSDILA
jgi:hypothetical protein